MIKYFPTVILLFVIMALCSCGSTKNLRYMQGGFDTAKLSSYKFPTPVIQKGDVLSIVVFSDNPAATVIYNQSVASGAQSSSSGGTSTSAAGYMVDELGNIAFQGLGKLHVEGLTKLQLTELLDSKLSKYLINPYYNIRFQNYRITVIGDVAKPAVYAIPSEKINILEAIGLAGDLNITARRDSILVIREINGKREFGSIDLRKPDFFTSAYYQLQQNDVVYVDFNKAKAAASDQVTARNVSIIATVVSTLAIVYTLFRK